VWQTKRIPNGEGPEEGNRFGKKEKTNDETAKGGGPQLGEGEREDQKGKVPEPPQRFCKNKGRKKGNSKGADAGGHNGGLQKSPQPK